jgi:hypothetical protein
MRNTIHGTVIAAAQEDSTIQDGVVYFENQEDAQSMVELVQKSVTSDWTLIVAKVRPTLKTKNDGIVAYTRASAALLFQKLKGKSLKDIIIELEVF